MLFLIERMKSHPHEWQLKNEEALKKASQRPNLIIYERLMLAKDYLLNQIYIFACTDEKKELVRWEKAADNECRTCISVLFHLIMAAVRSGDRSLMLNNIDQFTIRRFAEGFQPEEINELLNVMYRIICNELLENQNQKQFKQDISSYIGLTIQLAQDEIEDLYERLDKQMSVTGINKDFYPNCRELQRMVRQLSAFYQIFPEERENVVFQK